MVHFVRCAFSSSSSLSLGLSTWLCSGAFASSHFPFFTYYSFAEAQFSRLLPLHRSPFLSLKPRGKSNYLDMEETFVEASGHASSKACGSRSKPCRKESIHKSPFQLTTPSHVVGMLCVLSPLSMCAGRQPTC